MITYTKNMTLCFGRKAVKSQIIVKDCKSMSNLLEALRYYQSLQANFKELETQKMAMEIYFNEEYKNFLNDYNHIMSTHSDHLEEIHQQLGDCNLSQCKMAKRYCNNSRRRKYDEKSNEDGNDDHDADSKLEFYLELIDIIHFWLYHQYDVGMRIQHDVFNNSKSSTDERYYDVIFAKIQKEIMTKRGSMHTDRFNQHGENNKYIMHINNKRVDHEQLLMDTLFTELKEQQISNDNIAIFARFIEVEHYDTDAFIADISSIGQGSNIINIINDQQFIHFIDEYAQQLNGM